MALRNRTEAYDLSFFESRPLRVEVGGQPAEKPSKKQQNRNNVIELPKKELERNRRRHPHSLRAVGRLRPDPDADDYRQRGIQPGAAQ